MAVGVFEVKTRDGRSLEVVTCGDPNGFPLLFHGGQPSAAVPFERFDSAAREVGMRWVTYSRPGYGASSVRVRHAPRIVDDVEDVVDLLAALDVDRFVTLGWSGGGSRALACAALLGGRCLAAASLAGTAPHDGAGLTWTRGMAVENIAEYTAARAGRDTYSAYLEREFLPVLMADVDQFADAMGGLLPPIDRAALDRPFLEWLTATMHHSGAQRIAGICDDGLALVAPWGFEVATIAVPTLIYQGRADAMVPYSHGEWLAAHVPDAQVHLTRHDGHLTLVVRLPEILADLKRVAGLSPDPTATHPAPPAG